MLKVAVSHDVDRVTKTTQYITKSMRALIHGDLKTVYDNVRSVKNWKSDFWNFEKIMEIENKYSIKSTFFFLNEPRTYNVFDYDNWKHSFGRYAFQDMRVAEIIRLLDRNDWEIGLHGSFNSYKNIELLRSQKLMLEEIIGKKVQGIRQHYLNLEEGKTWKYQSESGFLYDSSWGLTRGIGFKENRIKPFHPLNNSFTVFPLTIMDYCFMGENEKWKRFEKICADIEAEEAVLVINWHNCAFNANDYPGSKEAFEEIIKRCIDKGAVFKKLNEYLK